MLYLSIFIATLCVQIPNILSMIYFRHNDEWAGLLQIAIYCIPVGVVATFSFSYFFGKGVAIYPYSVLMVMYIGLSLCISIVVQWIMTKQLLVSGTQSIGILLILAGLSLIIYQK